MIGSVGMRRVSAGSAGAFHRGRTEGSGQIPGG